MLLNIQECAGQSPAANKKVWTQTPMVLRLRNPGLGDILMPSYETRSPGDRLAHENPKSYIKLRRLICTRPLEEGAVKPQRLVLRQVEKGLPPELRS